MISTCYRFFKPLLWLLLASLGAAVSGPSQAAMSYYVRTDGGDANQGTGRADAAYPGNGRAQACASKHPLFALPPNDDPRIAGGDTLIHIGIRAGTLADWTLERVKVNANGWAGWDGDNDENGSNTGRIVIRQTEIAWTGCGER